MITPKAMSPGHDLRCSLEGRQACDSRPQAAPPFPLLPGTVFLKDAIRRIGLLLRFQPKVRGGSPGVRDR